MTDTTAAPATDVCRPARLADLAVIEDVDKAVFTDKPYPYFVIRQLFDVHGAHCVVAEEDGEVRGYALVAVVPAESTAWLLSLAVLPGSRRRGFGRALMDRALAICDEARVDRMRITVRPTNDVAYRLYKDSGFDWVRTEDTYFGVGEARDVLEKQFRR
ncbi:GNAT family N-acetyltransferase [Actinospica sp. MGRD01-02]|uniref:GNAT family N-acetyltransferase n=1 Tax=Actinospica acidithermotolerans TaxID=2828514 RepID=A0A941EDJ0_9ACTN|nr:GNAT family N-acetyltransferase [Actinospica acidithermotolerans]MBR7829531.1 GNAT family N-acetyltransferase [Actinospica acidithermotolerans]